MTGIEKDKNDRAITGEENTENGGENFEVEEPNKIEEQKTPLEELLGDENITQQVENVLQTYEYNPVYKENFVNYLKNNKIFKKKFLEELKKIQGDAEAIKAKIMEYLVKSCPELKMHSTLVTQSGGTDEIVGKIQAEGEKIQAEGEKIQENEEKAKALEAKMLAAKEIAQLDNVTPTPEQQAQAKQALEQNGVLQQLDNSPLVQANPTLKSEYLNLYATQLAYASPEHANKAHRAEFDSLIKGIENDLNLPDSSHLTYDTKKLVENRTNFFDEKRGNESLRKERDQNLGGTHKEQLAEFVAKDLSHRMNIYDYDSMTEEEFGNEKFSKEKVQELYTTVQKQLEQGIRETEEQKILTFLLKRRDETYDTTLPTVVEETSLLTMVGGPMKYLAGVDASHNFKNDLHLKEGKLKTTIGTVIRTDIYIDYSKKGDTRIYVSDFLNKKGGNGSYDVGLQYLKPTIITIANQETLFSEALKTLKSDTFQDQQKKWKREKKDPLEYQHWISTAIYETQMKLFEGKLGEKALANEEMKLQMERNITTQHIFNALKPLTATGILPLSFTKETTSPQFWDFIERIEHFTEYATLEELQQFNKNMKAFSNIIENMKTGNITQNKSELFNTKNESFSKQMFANTQLLIEGKTIGKNADLNLFSIIFSHCLPLSGEGTKNTECLQRFTDLITYNETGTLPTSLDPIITARDQTTATI